MSERRTRHIDSSSRGACSYGRIGVCNYPQVECLPTLGFNILLEKKKNALIFNYLKGLEVRLTGTSGLIAMDCGQTIPEVLGSVVGTTLLGAIDQLE